MREKLSKRITDTKQFRDDLKNGLPQDYFKQTNPEKIKEIINEIMLKAKVVNTVGIVIMVLSTDGLVEPKALGYYGPDPEDSFTQKLIYQYEKIIPNPQQDDNKKDVMLEHSGMKMPSSDVMRYVYKNAIMNRLEGLEKFGNYKIPERPRGSSL